MGNKIGRKRQVVDERYTRPQGLYQHRNVDHKKLRRLILDSKLAPCYPGDEDCLLDFEECPICFLYYPSLNRSRCCLKGICTECFLQMKPQQSARPTQCPFCKTSNYAVEYRGVRTKEEKGMEQIEEQRVIEAQIRMRQQELRDEEERKQKKQGMVSSGRMLSTSQIEYQEPSLSCSTESSELLSPQDSCVVSASRSKVLSRQNRDNNFDMDLEEIMLMEAVWLSIQEHGAQKSPGCGTSALPKPSSSNDCDNTHAVAHTEASPTLADWLHIRGDSTQLVESYPTESWTNVSLGNQLEALPVEENAWPLDHESEIAEAGTSYASSDTTSDTGPNTLTLPGFNIISGHPLPDSFEEQMMLAMAVSLAEARAKTSPQKPTWM